MKKEEIFERVKKILIDSLEELNNENSRKEITGETCLSNDLGLDSHDVAFFAVNLENHFSVLVASIVDEIGETKTVDEIVDLLEKKLSK